MQVSDFNVVMTGDDFQRVNLFSVEIGMPNGQAVAPPPSAKSNFGNFYNGADQGHIQKGLSYMAKSVSVPGKSIGTIDAKRFGPVYKVANDLIVDTVSMTFMLSEDWREHAFFDGWVSGIMGQVKKGTGSTVMNTGGQRQLYTLSYYEDYVSTVKIIPLDRQGGRSSTISLFEAWPSAIGPVEMSWGGEAEIATFNVTWAFKDWIHDSAAGWWADSDEEVSKPDMEDSKIGGKHTRKDFKTEMSARHDDKLVTEDGGKRIANRMDNNKGRHHLRKDYNSKWKTIVQDKQNAAQREREAVAAMMNQPPLDLGGQDF